jgi:hypothetical protein
MDSDSAKSHWWNDPAKRAVGGATLAAVPVALVNSVAFIGQFAYLNANVPWPVIARVLIAVTVESIAIYLAWHAHLAKMANDTAMRLVLGAYSVALLIASVNYSHFAHDWHPTPLAVIMGLASLISPFLWGVHTKRASRDKMMAMEPPLIEPHAVRLGGTRWTWHPLRSVRATSWASWHGENDPKTVLAHFAPLYGTADTPAPARKSVPAEVVQAVPTQPSVPAIEAATAPAAPAGPVNPTPGTVINGVKAPQVDGTVFLEADASLSGDKGVSPEMKASAELYLMALSIDQVNDMSVREIARRLLHDPNQRRLADKLKRQRIAAEPQRSGAPAREMFAPPQNTGMTAPVYGGGPVG